MLEIIVNSEHIQHGEEILRILEALSDEGINGTGLLMFTVKAQGDVMKSPRAWERLNRYDEFEVMIGRQTFVVPREMMEALSTFGSLSAKWSKEDGIDYEAMSIYLLKHCITQLQRYEPVIFHVFDRFAFQREGVLGWFKQQDDMEFMHLFAVTLATLCLGLPYKEITKQTDEASFDGMVLRR